MSGKDFVIGVLSVTAVILLTGLVIIHAVRPEPALAFGQSASAGGYLVTTSQLNPDAELLLILDTAAEKMSVYAFNVQLGRVEMLQPPIAIDKVPERRSREKK